MVKIKLGDKVIDKITGYVGVVVSISTFLNGCVQYGVQGKVNKENNIPEPVGIDEQSLELVKSKKKKVEKKENGGKNRLAPKQRGY